GDPSLYHWCGLCFRRGGDQGPAGARTACRFRGAFARPSGSPGGRSSGDYRRDDRSWRNRMLRSVVRLQVFERALINVRRRARLLIGPLGLVLMDCSLDLASAVRTLVHDDLAIVVGRQELHFRFALWTTSGHWYGHIPRLAPRRHRALRA